jgi:hypothetical protein
LLLLLLLLLLLHLHLHLHWHLHLHLLFFLPFRAQRGTCFLRAKRAQEAFHLPLQRSHIN